MRRRPRRPCSAMPTCCRSGCGRLPTPRRQAPRPAWAASSKPDAVAGRRVFQVAKQASIGPIDHIAKMIMITTISLRLRVLLAGCVACAILSVLAAPAHAQTVAVMVNGDPITEYDIEQRSKL